jgi:hypothetical protein
VGLFSLLACVRADAGTIVFSNLGQPGDTYGPDGISFGDNPFIPPTSTIGIVATRFQVNANSLVGTVETALRVFSGPTEFYAYILSDTAGLPDHVIVSSYFTDVAIGPQGPLLTSIPFASVELLAGTPYWFGLSTGPATFADWEFTPFYGDTNGSSNLAVGQISGDMTSNWILGSGGPLGREGAFRVNGTDIPEPAYQLPILAGLLYLARRAAKRPS